MAKKDLFGAKIKREVRARIESEIRAGKPRQQLLQELSEEYMGKETLAHYIASVLPPEDSLKLSRKNTVLFYLILSFGIYQTALKLSWLTIVDFNNKWLLFPLTLVLPLIAFRMAYLVKKAEGAVYTQVILLGLLVTAFSMRHKDIFDNTTTMITFFINFVWILVIALLANSISKQYFPHMRWKAIGLDKNGKYILSKDEWFTMKSKEKKG